MIPKEVFVALNDMVIEHPEYVDTKETILNSIAHGSSGQVIVVAGPTGVGKSKLLRDIDAHLIRKLRSGENQETSPPLIIEARAPKRGSFSWNNFFYDAFMGLNELSPERKRCLDRSLNETTQKPYPRPYKKASLDELHRMLVEAIKIKKPCLMLIDEAQLLSRVRNRTILGENLDVIKGLANEMGIDIIMFGTSETRDMLYANAQLSRRVTVVHFRRYQKTVSGVENFLTALHSVVTKLGLSAHENIYMEPFYLFDHGLGCVGVLIDWLKRSIKHQIRIGDAQLDIKHFKKNRLGDMALRVILTEALAFEAQQSNTPYFDYDACVQNDMFGSHREIGDEITTPEMTKPKRKRKPGSRLPSRDPAGFTNPGNVAV